MSKAFLKIVFALALCCACGFSFSQQESNSLASASATQTEQPLSEGEILYGYRCKGCHEPATPGAPDRKRLGRMETDELIEAMSKGEMKIMSNNLNENEKRLIAEFLSGE